MHPILTKPTLNLQMYFLIVDSSTNVMFYAKVDLVLPKLTLSACNHLIGGSPAVRV